MKTIVKYFLAGVLLLGGMQASHAQRTITLDDILNGERVSAVELSHSGRYVLEHFTVTDSSKTSRFCIVKDTGSGKQARYDSLSLHWMPKTDALLLQKGDSLLKVAPITGKRTLLAKGLPKGRVTMAPTEDYLVLSRIRKGPQEDPDIIRYLVPDDRQPGWRDRTWLQKWDLKTGDTLLLAQSKYSCHLEDISADGRKLLISSPKTRLEKRPTTVSDIVILDAVSLKADTLLRDAEFLESMCFSPDGKELLVRASPEAFDKIGEHINPGQTSSMIFQVLYKYNIASGAVTPLTDLIPQCVQGFVWSKADGQIYFQAEDRDYQALFTINPATGAIKRVPVEEELVTGFSQEAHRIAYVGEPTPSAPGSRTSGRGRPPSWKTVPPSSWRASTSGKCTTGTTPTAAGKPFMADITCRRTSTPQRSIRSSSIITADVPPPDAPSRAAIRTSCTPHRATWCTWCNLPGPRVSGRNSPPGT